jgi:alginate O-acetyltransferase complex protein AlgI
VLFNSHVFIFAFLPVVLIGWWGLRSDRWRLAFLTLASYFFYAWWNWRFLPLMITSTGVDYVAGRYMASCDREDRRRLTLILAIAANLALLGYFKYVGFFLQSVDGIGSWVGHPAMVPVIHVILPIGISFYTFNSMSYTIDVYRRRVDPETNLLRYTTFVSLFPHLIAGPIVRYATMEMQLRRLTSRLSWRLAGLGLFFFVCGLVKKVVIADWFAPRVDHLFATSAHLHLLSGWAAGLGYSIQLYFDFSGYSDMAVGLAFLLGFQFPQNFDSPYKSRNISEFWRKWHMSLSFWLRDYLFIPLGGSRGTRLQTLRNLAITMFLGGLWHGAAWTFVIWGLLHGVYLIVHNVLRGAGLTPPSVVVNRIITFVAVVAAFVIFRAPSIGVAGNVLEAMAGLRGVETWSSFRTTVGVSLAGWLALAVAFINLAPNTWEVALRPSRMRGLALGVAFAVVILLISQPAPFLYYQF